jgi:hypothetical protein
MKGLDDLKNEKEAEIDDGWLGNDLFTNATFLDVECALMAPLPAEVILETDGVRKRGIALQICLSMV